MMPEDENGTRPTPGDIAELAAARGFCIPPEDLAEVGAASQLLLEAVKRIEAFRLANEDSAP